MKPERICSIPTPSSTGTSCSSSTSPSTSTSASAPALRSSDRRRSGSGSGLSRRAFLGTGTVAAGSVVLSGLKPHPAKAGASSTPPSERVRVAVIGLGAMGMGHLRLLLGRAEAQVMAVCDVDRSRRDEGVRLANKAYEAARSAGRYRGCTGHNDYREVLAREDIDAVVIVTPDHWHSLMSVEAARAGKDIYCEKPISLTIDEGRRVVEAVRRYGRVFQTGTQYRSIPIIGRVCEFVRSGGLGKLKGVYTIWMKTHAPRSEPAFFPLDPVLPAEPVPEGLDWDLWVGPATYRDYNSAYHRNPSPGVVPWVFCDVFGAGAVTGYHSHAADVIQYAIGQETSGPVEVIHPSSGRFPTLTCRYADGTLLHHLEHWGQAKSLYQAVPAEARLEGLFGGLFVGERGWVTSMSASGPIEFGPPELGEALGITQRGVPIGANTHYPNWFECLRTRAWPSAHEEIGHRSATLGHLVTTAYRLGRSLRWDPARETFEGDDAANRSRRRALREPWRF